MPTTINSATTETLTIADSDTATVTVTGSIVRPSNVMAMHFSCIEIGRQATATVDGYVSNQGYEGVAVFMQQDGTLNIGPGAQALSHYTVRALQGGSITNSGLISGSFSAISGSTRTLTITNSGTIEGTARGIDFLGGAAGTHLNVTNSGLIKATNEVAVWGGNGADTVINTGRIETAASGYSPIQLGGGDDLYDGRNGGVVVGTIDLGDGNDTLYGSSGAETIKGGLGTDSLEGGGGDDVYVYDPNDTIVEGIGGGTDTIWTTVNVNALAANVENIVAIGDDLALTGNELANNIRGSGGNDTLIGGKGNDTLIGSFGDDTAVFSGPRSNYRVDYNSDGTVTVTDLVGQDGTDLLKSIRFIKFDTEERSVLNHAPTGLTLTGTSVAENAPARTQVGRLLAQDPDGNDIDESPLTYTIVSDPDGAFALSGENNDYLVLARPLNYEAKARHSVTVKVTDEQGGEMIQTFIVTVTDEIEIVPNFVIRGTPKADLLMGQEGNDTLYGGAGKDVLTGGAGKDIFVFDTKPNKKTNLDTITDYSVANDTIWLDNKYLKKLGKGSASKPGKLDKKFFKVADKAKDANDYLVYSKKMGVLYYDADGSGSGKAVEIAKLAKNLKLTASDFFVI